jgi:glycosyltransferase involved in cell wall biosynthesis
MLISVCVASIRANTLPHLVTSLLKQTHADWELIIAVQGSDPNLHNAVKEITARDERIRTLFLDTFGKSAALNTAVLEARGDVLAVTDDDCEADPNWLAVIAECFESEPDAGIVAGDVSAAPKPARWVISACPATYTMECIYRPASSGFIAPDGFYFGGGNLAVRRDVWEKLGGFDPYIGPGTPFPAAEDTDFGLRAEEQDIVMWTTPRALLQHTYGRRTGLLNLLRHFASLAKGEGAHEAKLELRNHSWITNPEQPPGDRGSLKSRIRQIPYDALELFKYRYKMRAKKDYLATFRLDERNISVPKAGTPAP